MAFTHGSNTVVKLNAVNLSTFTNATDFGRKADVHDVTCYGKTAKVKKGGLLDGKVTHSGVYDDGAAGPRGVIEPLIGSTVVWLFQPEGTGVGKAQNTGNVVVASYTESAPVAEMIKWSVELELSDSLNNADQ